MASRDPLDDLPERPPAHVQNDRARWQFKRLVTDPLFLVRDETDNDYGVDISIEALANNGASPTNIRTHVQLKSSGKEANADGSYSYSVSRANLNYLLNAPNAFYVFYANPRDTFYYQPADDVYRAYEAADTDWRTQDTVTVRFTRVLDEIAVRLIHEALLTTATTFKAIRLEMHRAGISPGARFVYGELHFESSAAAFEEYLESQNTWYAYRTNDDGKVIFMHDAIWEGVHGPIPKGYQVYHINGNTLDNQRHNLDIIKTTETFPLEAFQAEVQADQAYNIAALIIDGAEAELRDVPSPPQRLFEKVIQSLRDQGWHATDDEMAAIKNLIVSKLGMKD